ncbi:inhibitor of Bruton tyrosine kinase-like [Clytia hemisphaerica]|uniref:Inhibitor of Bruton tyrosine kinase n=1 Tax=Clytia hemisphaerica TaxID=252671 RepID=A0A7M5V3X7_9CNID
MDCTSHCKLKAHGSYLTSIITSETDGEVFKKASNEKCNNSSKVLDHLGRNVFHVATSCGNIDVLEYLIEEQNVSKSNLQSKDKESGWTPLHRALYYGNIHCAVYLHKVLKEWKPFDSEGLSPLDLVTQDSPRIKKKKKRMTKLGIVVVAYEAELQSELTIQIDDIIEMADRPSGITGWAIGKNRETGHEGFYPQHFVEEIKQKVEKETKAWYTPQNTVHLWGNNVNFTLGLGDSKSRNTAELNETLFHSQQSVKDVVVTKFHTVYLTNEGNVFTCGHGPGGRLGHGQEQTLLYPEPIKTLSCYHCTIIAASNHHTVVVTELGDVYTFGLNDFHQLGLSPAPISASTPQLVYNKNFKGKQIMGAAAGRFHTVIHSDKEVYVFGYNGGQMGLLKSEEIVITPKQVSRLLRNKTEVKMVAASDGATLCLYEDGEVYILQDFVCRKIKDIGSFLPGTKIRVTGGELQLKRSDFEKPEPLQIAILQSTGVVFVWRSSTRQFRECYWQGCKLPVYSNVVDIALGKHLMITTDTGQVYFGHFSNRTQPGQGAKPEDTHSSATPRSSRNKVEVVESGQKLSLTELNDRTKKARFDHEEIMLERVPLVYRSVACFCDPKSRTYAVIQFDPITEMKRRPEVSPSTLESDLRRLVEKADLYDDLHDLVIESKNKTCFPAHRFVLQLRLGLPIYTSLLFSTYDNKGEGKKRIILKDKDGDQVKKWLQRVYSEDRGNMGTIAKMEDEATSGKLENDEDLEVEELPKEMISLSKLDLADPSDDYFQYPKNEGDIVQGGPGSGNIGNAASPTSNSEKSAYSVFKEKQERESKEDKKKPKKKKKEPSKLNSFEGWRKYPECSDVTIESVDQKIFKCHKCILTARSEYFQNMLNFSWMECSSSSTSSSIKIPVPSNILDVVINFLYTGNIKHLAASNDVTFIGEVLVCADQLLILRLKELCEVCLSEKVTLKNVVDIFQFSCMYNAEQLRVFTSDYISMNMPYFLDAKLLENVPNEDLEILSDEYKFLVADMDERVITPSFHHREVDRKVEELQNAITSDLNKIKARRRRNSSRSDVEQQSQIVEKQNQNVEKNSVEDMRIDEESKQVVFVDDSQTSSMDTTTRQIKVDEKPSSWGKVNQSKVPNTNVSPSVFESKELLHKKQNTPSPFKKKSQRERRRQASQSKSESEEASVINTINEEKKENVCPWGQSKGGTPSPPVKTFIDLLSEESSPKLGEEVEKNNTQRKQHIKAPPKFKKKLLLGDKIIAKEKQGPAKSAWGALPPVTKTTINLHDNTQPQNEHKEVEVFTNVIQDQEDEKEQIIKDSKKPLTIIQLEERAMTELKDFYEKNALKGEKISVQRIRKIDNVIPFWEKVLH